jgi:hypothetical protein
MDFTGAKSSNDIMRIKHEKIFQVAKKACMDLIDLVDEEMSRRDECIDLILYAKDEISDIVRGITTHYPTGYCGVILRSLGSILNYLSDGERDSQATFRQVLQSCKELRATIEDGEKWAKTNFDPQDYRPHMAKHHSNEFWGGSNQIRGTDEY